MVATTWPDDVARDQRARLKTISGKGDYAPSKGSPVRKYVVVKSSSSMGARPVETTTPPRSATGNRALGATRRGETYDPPWLSAVLSATTDVTARSAFRALHSELVQLRRRSAFREISSVLGKLARHHLAVHPMLLVAGLRITFLYRSEVDRWTATRDEISKGLRSRGLDPAELLLGLLE